jgi:hypothetical protein
MPEEMKKQVDYAVVCVNEFAKKNALHPRTAFLYLYNYRGIEFLKENYEIEHTLSLEEAVEDLEQICRNNGGRLS